MMVSKVASVSDLGRRVWLIGGAGMCDALERCRMILGMCDDGIVRFRVIELVDGDVGGRRTLLDTSLETRTG